MSMYSFIPPKLTPPGVFAARPLLPARLAHYETQRRHAAQWSNPQTRARATAQVNAAQAAEESGNPKDPCGTCDHPREEHHDGGCAHAGKPPCQCTKFAEADDAAAPAKPPPGAPPAKAPPPSGARAASPSLASNDARLGDSVARLAEARAAIVKMSGYVEPAAMSAQQQRAQRARELGFSPEAYEASYQAIQRANGAA